MQRLRKLWHHNIVIVLLVALAGSASALAAADSDFSKAAAPLLKQFCMDCHEGAQAESNIDLARLAEKPAFDTAFRTWQKVAAALTHRKMPPKDEPQPSDALRQVLIGLVSDELRRAMDEHAGDPGAVVVRRLTSAEYAYTIQDLTGLDLDLDQDLIGDGVGGEGFTNVGSAQFVQDSTLERYLEAAKRVASHAVIGAGPLAFYRDPGKTGLELSAMHRIQDIYRRHGFRTAAGEGGEPFGLDKYPKAFFAAWRYRNRDALGLRNPTLSSLAAEAGLQPRFVEHVHSVLSAPSSTFPTSEIVSRWQALPNPSAEAVEVVQLQQQVQARCEEIYGHLADWQKRLAASVGDEEEAAVLSEASLTVSKSRAFTARIIFPAEAKTIRVQFSVISGLPDQTAAPVVIWHQPRMRYRRLTRRRDELQPLKHFLTPEQSTQFAFGEHPASGKVEAGDFVTKGPATRSFEFTIPEGVRGAEIQVEAQLDLEHSEDGVIRCEVGGGDIEKPVRAVSATLLADPQGAAYQTWKAGVLEFAKLFPQVSHREPAPSDRDPIPAPFDNTYNMPERNFFHTKVKYHRDDRFLVEMLLADSARTELDTAWTDLLGSFEYHEVLLRFVAEKYKVDLAGQTIADVDAATVAKFPAEMRDYVTRQRDEYRAVQQRILAAEPRQVSDLWRLAQRAWRRPLSRDEMLALTIFYEFLKANSGLSHADALRATLVRILMSPAFLYRAERSSGDPKEMALTDWELASRLSYFLWSSLPDEELTQAAEAGKLRKPEELARQTRRMLRDPKARRLATEFFGQWLGFYQFDRWRGVDPQRFPEFTDGIKSAMYDEAISLFEHIVRDDRPVNEILFADYGFLHHDLASFYGIPLEAAPSAVSRVENLGAHHRGGLLGLGAILTVTSAPLRTSPVKRGDWVLRRILGSPVPPPPADAGSIPADDVLPTGPRTVRERLDAHRQKAACTNCHSRIDPLGFALEQYDSIGRWREKYRDGAQIDTSGTLHDGTEIKGTDGLRRYLKEQESQFQRTLCTKLLCYALGRGEAIGDQRLIEELVAGIGKGDDRMSNLAIKIVTSHQFRYHRGEDAGVSKASAAGGGKGN